MWLVRRHSPLYGDTAPQKSRKAWRVAAWLLLLEGATCALVLFADLSRGYVVVRALAFSDRAARN